MIDEGDTVWLRAKVMRAAPDVVMLDITGYNNAPEDGEHFVAVFPTEMIREDD